MMWPKIYSASGYINMAGLIELSVPFIFIIGARGIGKTYGAIRYEIENGKKFILMRRSQTQAALIEKPEFSPVKPVFDDLGLSYKIEKISTQNSAIFIDPANSRGSLDTMYMSGAIPFCYTAALSTFSNLRGFDASDVDHLIFDEFIPQKQERPIKAEAEAFFNCYETINRNRELQGREPLKAVLLANSFDVASPIFTYLKIVRRAERMLKSGQEIFVDKIRGFALVIPRQSPISRQKSDTALYRLVGQGSEYAEMALENTFKDNDFSDIRSVPLKEVAPVCEVGELCIYKHKSEGIYYATTHRMGAFSDSFTWSDVDITRFCQKYLILRKMYYRHRIFFDTYFSKALFDKIWKG